MRRPSRKGGSHLLRWTSPKALKAQIEKQGEGQVNFLSLSSQAGTSILLPSDIGSPGPHAFGLRCNSTFSYPGSLVADGTLLDFLVSATA